MALSSSDDIELTTRRASNEESQLDDLEDLENGENDTLLRQVDELIGEHHEERNFTVLDKASLPLLPLDIILGTFRSSMPQTRS